MRNTPFGKTIGDMFYFLRASSKSNYFPSKCWRFMDVSHPKMVSIGDPSNPRFGG
jgi:hypothetical protein